MKSLARTIRPYQGFAPSLAIILLCTVGVIYGIIPAVRRSLALMAESSKISTENTALRAKLKLLQSLDEESLRSYVLGLNNAIPGDKSLPTLLSTVDGLALATGVTVTNLDLASPGSLATESGKRVSAEERKLGSSITPFTIEVTGTYDQIRNFFDKAVSIRRLLRVVTFKIGFREDTSASARVEMNAFYVPVRTNLGSVETKLAPLTEKEEGLLARLEQMQVLTQEPPPPLVNVPGAGKPNPFVP